LRARGFNGDAGPGFRAGPCAAHNLAMLAAGTYPGYVLLREHAEAIAAFRRGPVACLEIY
jgi:hypothetical protein